MVEDRIEGEQRIMRRRTSGADPPRRHSIWAITSTRAWSAAAIAWTWWPTARWRSALQPQAAADRSCRRPRAGRAAARRRPPIAVRESPPLHANPLERLETLASEVASALEFMASQVRPAGSAASHRVAHPGTFGQGFAGLIYLSTLAYLKHLPRWHWQTPRTSGAVLRATCCRLTRPRISGGATA